MHFFVSVLLTESVCIRVVLTCCNLAALPHIIYFVLHHYCRYRKYREEVGDGDKELLLRMADEVRG